jgi:large subunit ribosomal protein L32
MSVPSQRKSPCKTRSGRSHDALKELKYKQCPKCKKPVKPHQACSKCGTYKGKEVVSKKYKKTK